MTDSIRTRPGAAPAGAPPGVVAVFGAGGFLGSHLVAGLCAAGWPLRAIARSVEPALAARRSPSCEVIEADLRDPLATTAALQGVDTVVQLVSTSSPGLGNSLNVSDIQENVIPHVQAMRIAIDAGVRRYVFVSSGGTVYGPGAAVPTPEDAPQNPISSHGLTKLTIEKYLQMHAHVDGLDTVILRLANPFGPGQRFRKGQGLIPAVLGRVQQGLPVRIFGEGAARRDYVYVDDVSDALLRAIAAPGAAGQTLNIGSGQGRSVAEVIDMIEDLLGGPIARENVGARKTDVDVNILDIRRAREVLGWSPRIAFRDGLARTLAAEGFELRAGSSEGDRV